MELNLSDKDQMHFMGMALLLLSFVGYYTAYKTFIKGHSSFYPMIYTALAVLFVYFGGLFGLISIAPIIFVLGGTILLPITVLYRRKKGSDALWCVSDLYVSIFIVLGIIWGYVVTRRIGLSHPDDFSHWFRICKVINDEELYPHTSDIRYPMYLPGTATWIYFFTRFVGFDAYNCLWGQLILNLFACSALISATAVVSSRRERLMVFISTVVTSMFLCAVSVSVYSLLVDNILGLTAMACAVYVLFYKDKINERRVRIGLCLLFSLLSLIKISAFLFIVLVIAWCMIILHGEVSGKVWCKRSAKLAVELIWLPVLLTVAYRIRCSIFFSNVADSSQAVSLERYSSLIAEKTSEQVTGVISDILFRTFIPIGDYPQNQVVLLILGFFIVRCLKKRNKEKNSKARNITVYLVVSYVIYAIALILTYLFSMDSIEATGLGCYDRYMGTMTVFICGTGCYYLIRDMSSSKNAGFLKHNIIYICVVGVVGQLLFGFSYLCGADLYKPSDYYTDDAWRAMEECVPEPMEYNESRYLVIWDSRLYDGDSLLSYKPRDIAETYLRSKNVEYCYSDSITADSDLSLIENYDYLVIVGDLSPDLNVLGDYTASGEIASGVYEVVVND